ncbi:hypothetical protein V9T40_012342 [Parthenolecanium corni]|uniref:U3 small nucleolar RNA-associated protein 11 n=1 Tax=Parthenolecanium corni TaxID=536013 RepID=A0AAN9T8P6_9HEMI
MSSWKKASKVNQKTHRERQQLHSRSHLGFLEKKKDYKVRANRENQKNLLIKSLKKRALNKNPDEFYFNMVNSKVVDDVHHVKRKETKHTPEQLKLMQTRDLKYVNSRRTMEVKKIDKLKSQLHFIDKADQTPNSHIFFVEDEEAKDFDLCRHLNTHPSLINRRSNRPRLEDLEKYSFPDLDDASSKRANSKKMKMYRELEQRMEREKTLSVVQRKLEVKRELTRNNRGVKKVKPATPNSAPVYKWKQERKK